MKFYVNFILVNMLFLKRLLNKIFSKILFLALIFLSFSGLKAQTGSISGKVTDKSNNDPLIGANVLVIGTSTGASTDIDGHYEIKSLQPGKYKLRFSYISYRAIVVEYIEVKSAKSTTIDVSLAPSATQLEEVVVTAEALKSTEASILKIQKNSDNIVDGVSAELISKNNSSNGTDVLKRMTGINISEGKYAFIRGIGDRYNNTLLNGSSLPSTDPEKKSFSYDLFPASLIENVVTAKTFTPDEPADFAGGLVQINTIEFPSSFILDFTTSGTYNTNTTGKSFTTYNGGNTDYLGFDDGSRDMPTTITGTKVSRGNYSTNELTAISSSFKNNWSTHSVDAPFNGSLKLNVGDKYEFSNNSILGFVGSLTYSNSGNTKNLEKSFYDFSGARYSYTGSSYNRTVNWGGLLNVSYKFLNTNKISFKNVYNQDADDITSFFSGDYRYAEQYREVTSLNYVSRSLLSNQLLGEHSFHLFSGLNLNWNLSFSQSRRNEPDARRYVYKRNLDEPVSTPLVFLADPSVDTRYFGNLTDRNFDGDIGFTLKLFDNPELPKLKFGYAYIKKDRNFNARSFGFRNTGTNRDPYFFYQPVDSIFQTENLLNNILQVQEITKQSDSYTSNQYIRAGYLMFDATILGKLRVVAGARLENSTQNLNTIDLRGEPLGVETTYNDLLPSINLTYNISEKINLRSAYSITLARPQFRELAPFSYFDFIDNTLVQGNPNLTRTLIRNYDFRFELFPGAGELFAVSFFYKRFSAPIEETLQASANEPIRSFANADKATNLGMELEIRKSLGFAGSIFENFSFIGNASFIHSKVEISDNNYQQSERALQGQAPYIFNMGLYYDNLEMGFDAAVTYNKVGERIANVGSKQLGNILEQPLDHVDFSISKNIFSNINLKFAVKDIINQDKKLIQQAPGGDRLVGLERTGRNFSFSIKYKL